MRKLLSLAICVWILSACCISGSAHSGRTDASGGHTNHSTGEYHYHHGFPAHQHDDMNGDGKNDCPYNFYDRAGTSSNSGSNSESKDFIEAPAKKSDRVLEFLTDTLPLVLILAALFFIGTSWIVGIINDDFAVFWLSLGFKLIGIAVLVLVIGYVFTVLQTVWRSLSLLFTG